MSRRCVVERLTLDVADDAEDFVFLFFLPVTADDNAHVLRTIVLAVVASHLVDGQFADVRNVAAKIGGVG